MADEQVVISVADEQLTRLDEVVDELRAAGLRVGEVLASAGVVTGTVDGAAVSALSAVPGVLDVERSRTYQVPPPDSSVQ